MSDMKIVKRKLSELRHPDLNSRKHPEKQIRELKRSIQKNGQTRLLVIDENNVIWIGNGLYQAMTELGMTEAHCLVKEGMSETDKKKMMVSDNRIFDLGVDDSDALEQLLRDFDDLDVPGYEEELLRTLTDTLPGADDLLGRDQQEEIRAAKEAYEKKYAEMEAQAPAEEKPDEGDSDDDDFDIEAELKKPCITKPCDLWLLGRHRLFCGDSTDAKTYKWLMGTLKANLVVTDPPYNVNYEGTAGKIQNDNMEDDSFYKFLLAAFRNMERVMEDDASIYVFHADTEGLNFRKAFTDAGFYLSGTCIWKKQSLVLGRSPYQWQHEPILFGWKNKGLHRWYAGRKETTIWEYDKPSKNPYHPTMKPVALLKYPILNSSMSNSVVLDPFGGSGSTLIACEQTGRVCHMIELDPKYCDVIVKRFIEQVGSSTAVRVVRDGQTFSFDELEAQNADD